MRPYPFALIVFFSILLNSVLGSDAWAYKMMDVGQGNSAVWVYDSANPRKPNFLIYTNTIPDQARKAEYINAFVEALGEWRKPGIWFNPTAQQTTSTLTLYNIPDNTIVVGFMDFFAMQSLIPSGSNIGSRTVGFAVGNSQGGQS